MRKQVLVLFLLLAGSNRSIAQNWQTIRLQDTTYFSAGPHGGSPAEGAIQAYDPHTPVLASIIRSTFITLDSSSGIDKVFLLPTCRRDTLPGFGSNWSHCMDTLSPSWMGKLFIRKLNGFEYYFNSKGDTITIQTLAGVGTSWTLGKDTSGHLFKGTVAQIGTAIVDGAADSFKTISIQAFNGTLPIFNRYNNMVLQLSKDHGWLKTLDFYRFPNFVSHWDYGGEVVDSCQHVRLSASIATGNLLADNSWLFAPGNEWIWQHWYGGLGRVSQYAQHDSVISTNPMPGNTLLVTIKTKIFKNGGIPFDTSSYVHTDTIQLTGAPLLLSDLYHKDPRIQGFSPSPLTNRYFVDSNLFCGKYIIEEDKLISCGGPGLQNGCYKFDCLDGVDVAKRKYLQGFGRVYNYSYWNDLGTYDSYNEDLFSYIKIGNCTTGTKINVFSFLGITEKMKLSPFVQPNPVDKLLKVTLPDYLTAYKICLRDITGTPVLKREGTTSTMSIPTGDYPSGVYFLELLVGDYREIVRVVIAH